MGDDMASFSILSAFGFFLPSGGLGVMAVTVTRREISKPMQSDEKWPWRFEKGKRERQRADSPCHSDNYFENLKNVRLREISAWG